MNFKCLFVAAFAIQLATNCRQLNVALGMEATRDYESISSISSRNIENWSSLWPKIKKLDLSLENNSELFSSWIFSFNYHRYSDQVKKQTVGSGVNEYLHILLKAQQKLEKESPSEFDKSLMRYIIKDCQK